MDTLDPLIKALVEKLPPPGSVWSYEKRAEWLEVMKSALTMIYLERAPKKEKTC